MTAFKLKEELSRIVASERRMQNGSCLFIYKNGTRHAASWRDYGFKEMPREITFRYGLVVSGTMFGKTRDKAIHYGFGTFRFHGGYDPITNWPMYIEEEK